jgi:hypothetical protein
VTTQQEALERMVIKANDRIMQLESESWELREKLDAANLRVAMLMEACGGTAAMLNRQYEKASLADIEKNGWFAAAILHAIQNLQAAMDKSRAKP